MRVVSTVSGVEHIAGRPSRDRITKIVADFLHVEPETLKPQIPLVLYGLDSVGSIELVAALEDAIGRELPEWLLLEHPDLDALARALCDGDGAGTGASQSLNLMLADSQLPEDIHPLGGSVATAAGHVLLTGATGFLGAYLLRDLLCETDAEIWCLVRATDGEAGSRLWANLGKYGIDANGCQSRVRTIAGDLTLPNFGLSASRYEELSESLDAIFHAAADVNWVLPYEALRHANVIATRELLRLACAGRPKAFHFISSLSVCYATGGPLMVQEDDDMLSHVDRLPLGYAQSKCVSESLARKAAARGLPVWIHRPPLIAGDSQTGASNLDDLIALLVKGCIEMKAAPDLDWAFDAMPVDYVSRAIVRLSRTTGRGLRSSHLHHPEPRHWRECVLWMNLFGYPVQLLPYADWLGQLEIAAESPGHALHRLRGFFLRRTPGGATVPELYQQSTRSAVNGDLTQKTTAAAGLTYPRLDAELFDRYFGGYLERGFLPPPSAEGSSRRSVERAVACYENPRFLERLLRTHYSDPSLQVEQIAITPFGDGHSIISELTSWRRRQASGLFKCRLTLRKGPATDRRQALDLVIKAKPSDREALDVGETVAAMCDTRLADAFRKYRSRIGLTAGHLREIAIYEQSDERLRRYLPRCFGTWRDDEQAEWGMALEHLQQVVLMDEVNPEAWAPDHIDAVMAGLSDIHSVWYGREKDLAAVSSIGGLGEPISLDRAVELTPLWRALAAHAAPHFTSWAGPSVARTHKRLVESIAEWWQPLNDLPRTLIHNDFSPRNVALRRHPDGLRLCAYDWELAAFGPPQRDLAEFLCFVLATNVGSEVAERRVDQQRRSLEAVTGQSISEDLWRLGFTAALADLLIDKLAFYAMVNRVRPQRFLPRVMRTWRRLYDIFSHRQGS